MIISASRRTDIPTYYSEWFFNRIKEGYVYVRNPMNVHQISRISLSPEVIDGIVFWTKNPIPMMSHLDKLKDYAYYFQFTVNSYGKDIESNVPNKNDIVIPAFRELSKKIGAEKVIWRYDPIMLTEKYTIDYHVNYFNEIAKRLSGYTNKCVISFVDLYRNTQSHLKELRMLPLGDNEMYELAERLVEIAHKNNLIVESCAEKINLEQFGIQHGHCIDCELFEKILNCKMNLSKDKNQRPECGCMESIDIGAYNTCKNGCRYCYANFSEKTVIKNTGIHNPQSPLIFGNVMPDDKITERKMISLKDSQISLF
ncbi:MAG: DUF1848 domain-containing protein [Clostridia bacterium]|nr:DUF1848 domain-containing protein [Clostridia bacterium]